MRNSQKLKFTLVIFLLAGVCLNGILCWVARKPVVEGYADFSIFYTAGLMLRRGEATRLYDNHLQWQTQREFRAALQGAGAGAGLLPYNHAPFEALMFVPLGYMPYPAAYWVWMALNLALLAGVLEALRPQLPAFFSTPSGLPYLAALAFFPIAFCLIQGQDSILLLGIYCLAFLALRRGKDFRAGLLLGLGLFKFHLVLPFACVLLLRRRWRAIAGFAASGAVVGAISLALVGWKELLYYPHYVWWINQHPLRGVIVPGKMANLRGLIAGWNGNVAVPLWVNAIIGTVSMAALIWAAWQWNPSNRGNETSWRAGFSLCLVVTFLVSYHGYNQDMSILFLPLLLLGDQLPSGRGGTGREQNIAWACMLAMFCTPLYLILTLHYQHQNLFTLVLLALAWSLAEWRKKSSGVMGVAAAAETQSEGLFHRNRTF